MLTTSFSPALRMLLLCVIVAGAASSSLAHDHDRIEPRIGYKDASVLKNELRQLGFPDAEVIRLDERAQMRIRVNGEIVRIEIDRQLGGIRVLEASPAARALVVERIPAHRMRPNLTAPALQRPVRPDLIIDPAIIAADSREDCLGFNPESAAAKRIDGRWKVVDGSQWLFDFGADEDEARMSERIIKHYGMNKSCYVGRPNPPLTYMLVDDAAPQGAYRGEDCLVFNPSNLAVISAQDRWRIADGNHWLFDFADRRDLADNALAVIRRYGFTHSCFVGRPKPDFSYLRK